jgi:hypothetical protein
MNKSFKSKQWINSHSLSEKLSFAKRLREVWQDLQDDPHWKYEQLSPVQLLEKSELSYTAHNCELARANWFWRRRPRLLQATSCIVWLLVALGVPLWLFIVPAIGVPFMILAAVIVNTEIVQSVRWRRQYELSVDRLIRTLTNSRDTFGLDVFP